MAMAKYVSYYDESGWDSLVEVMNIQNARADYQINVYDRDGSQYWQDRRTLTRFQTERIAIREKIPNRGQKEGLIVIEPVGGTNNDFPAMLIICAEGQDYKVGNRFVPFIRVP
jgi:hypothetical protein